ncbi:MAG: hypothetical protein H7A09_03515 [Oceanospirillaceae bacterium]|nr:hypothetical protein [Oceanospirillaceae bacterium]MCP5350340.1 hypothetical protein [Oceanospirillaceae bacterium]
MDETRAPIRLSVPTLERTTLSFCGDSLESFEAWVNELPMANVGAAAKQLFDAIRELNVTHQPSLKRFKMLELMRSRIYTICDVLSKRYITQSAALSDNDIRVANLAQTLQSNLATGYKHVILAELQQQHKDANSLKLLTFSIHRAITEIAQNILRNYQLYYQPPSNTWLEAHQMYYLAETRGLLTHSIKDSQCSLVSTSTIKDIYCRLLLLGCAKPNQLRQQDMAALYQATELWASRVRIVKENDPHSLFSFSFYRDTPPNYKKLQQEAPSHSMRGLDTHVLVHALSKHLQNEEGAVTVPAGLNETVITHVMHTWGVMVERSFRRASTQGEIQVGMGMISAHYFAAGEKSFPYLLKEWSPQAIERKKAQKTPGKGSDVWAKSFDAGQSYAPESDSIEFDAGAFFNKHKKNEPEPDTGPKGHVETGNIINTSPGGYCLTLDNTTSVVQAGELVILREPRMPHWSLGIIRWLRTMRENGIQLGIEMLAPKVTPVGIRILNKTGENGELLRGLIMPALPAAGQTETLIAPILPFKVGSKIEVHYNGDIQRALLNKRLNYSRSFAQYEFRGLTQVGIETEAPSRQKDDDEFAGLWDKL